MDSPEKHKKRQARFGENTTGMQPEAGEPLAKKLNFRPYASFIQWSAAQKYGNDNSATPTETEDNSAPKLSPPELTDDDIDQDAEKIYKKDRVFYKKHVALNDSDSSKNASSRDVENDGFMQLDQLIPGYGQMLKGNSAYIISIKKDKKKEENDEENKNNKEKNLQLNEKAAIKLNEVQTVGELLDWAIENAYYIFENDNTSDELWNDLMKIYEGKKADEISHSCIKEAYFKIDRLADLKDTIMETFSTEQKPVDLLATAQKFPRLLLLLNPEILKEMMQLLITNANSLGCLRRLTVKHAYAFYLARDTEFEPNENYKNFYLEPLSIVKAQLNSLKRSIERNDPEEKKIKKIETLKKFLEKVTPELGMQQQCRNICKKYLAPLPPAQLANASPALNS